MHVAVIGPLEVLTDDLVPVLVSGAEERLLLAALTAAAPDAVSTDRLVQTLWDGDAPADSHTALHDSIVGLRRALEPGLPGNASGRYVVRRRDGYALAVPPGEIDALRFVALADRGGSQLSAGDAADAARLFSSALDLWRGEPYAEWPGAAFAEDERRRLTRFRERAIAGLAEARRRLAEQPAPPIRPVQPAPLRLEPRLLQVEVPAREPAGSAADRDRSTRSDDPAAPAAHATGTRIRTRRIVLVGILVAALIAASLAVRFQQAAEDESTAAVVAEANRLATRSATVETLDMALLLAVEAFRTADTQDTRDALLAVLTEHPRAERVGRFTGIPQDPVLADGDRVLVHGTGVELVGWSIGPTTHPSVIMEIPASWGAWLVAAPSPTEGAAMGAGVDDDGVSWLRTVSFVDGTSRLLLEGEEVGGWPVDGAMSADGRRILLLVATPEDEGSRWQLIEVDAADGTRRDTGVAGTFDSPVAALAADFADDAGSFVLWEADTGPAVLVDVAGGEVSPIAVERPVASTGFRALPTGAAQLWDDGAVTIVDRRGLPVQLLDLHELPVLDIAVDPDSTWGATADSGGVVLRWQIDPATGRWTDATALTGHEAEVVGVETGTGRTVVTVSLDTTVISWDMSPDGGVVEVDPQDEPSAWLDQACAIVARDFTEQEWEAYLRDRPYRATCTDLL